MKTLPNAGGNADWDNELVSQLSFIKKHLRYPLNKTTLAPTLLFLLLTGLIMRVGFASYSLRHSHGTGLLSYLLALLILLPVGFSIYRYIQTIRFVSVPTPFGAAQNMQLIQQFLKAMHLAVFQHPDAPEVFQIISKNIRASGLKDEQREVMVFIADDNRILLNSHFTGSGFTLIPSAGNYRKMAEGLKKWLDNNIKNTNTGIRHDNYF